MKKLPVYVALFTCMFFALCSSCLQAQLLKRLMNTVKNTAQNRADDKASQSTNKAIDQAESQTGQGDSASTNKVLGAFAKAAQQNPNDTSSADLTMKALGILTGGGGVSPADSAAAIKSYANAKGGAGFYYETMTTTTTKKNGSAKDTARIFMTSNGEGRKEMRINIPGTMSAKFINIGHTSNAKYSILLYPETKTYALNITDTSLINATNETYQVTRVGTETVQGYSCSHVILKSTMGRGMFKSTSSMDLWTSTEVPGYSLIKKMMTSQNIKPRMLQALEKNNAGGYIVKMASSAKDFSMEMLLIKAEPKTFPASLFTIPAGYKLSNENMMYHMMSGVKK